MISKRKTTLRKELSMMMFYVPPYHESKSWSIEKQLLFFSDLDKHIEKNLKTPYYFGSFLFEETSFNKVGIIDGVQRISTITIILSALFSELSKIRPLNEKELSICADMVQFEKLYRFLGTMKNFSFFKDYIVNDKEVDESIELDNEQKILLSICHVFKEQLSRKNEKNMTKLLDVISKAKCSTYVIYEENEAFDAYQFLHR